MKTVRSLTRWIMITAALALGSLALARPASAEPVAFILRGEVTSLYSAPDQQDGSVAVGTPVTVKLVTDPSLPNTLAQSFTNVGVYGPASPGFGLYAQVGNYSIGTDPERADMYVVVQDGFDAYHDIYEASTYQLAQNGVPLANPDGFNQMVLFLRDLTNAVISSIQQPTEPLDLTGFHDRVLVIYAGGWDMTVTLDSMESYTLTSQEQTERLSSIVASLVRHGQLTASAAKSLEAILDLAGDHLQDGRVTAVASLLGAFVRRLEALVRSGDLTAAAAQPLIDQANAIIHSLTS